MMLLSNIRSKGTKREWYVIDGGLRVIPCNTSARVKFEKCLLHRQLHSAPFWCSLKVLRWRRAILVFTSGD